MGREYKDTLMLGFTYVKDITRSTRVIDLAIIERVDRWCCPLVNDGRDCLANAVSLGKSGHNKAILARNDDEASDGTISRQKVVTLEDTQKRNESRSVLCAGRVNNGRDPHLIDTCARR